MRRFVLGCLVLLVGMAGVFVYNGVAKEREFQRLIADGDQAFADDQPFLAIEAYSGALALDPGSMAAHLKRGETYHRQGDLRDARRDLTRAASLDPSAPRPHERLGDVSFSLEQYAEATEHYFHYIRLDDRNPSVLYKLALAYERDGRVNRAVPRLRQAITLDPEFVEAHYVLGLCLREQGRLEEAQIALATAVDLSPGFLEAREVLAAIHRARGELREELRQLDALAALDRTRPERHVARGLAYARSGQTDMAVLALGRAAEEHPDQPRVFSALGRVWLEIAETRADRVALKKAIEALLSVPQATASSEALTLLGRAYLLEGDTDAAHRVLTLALERFPVDPAAFLQLAWLEEGNRDWTKAQRLRQSHRLLTQPAAAEGRSTG
jgi:tetratricopeptide (TPR) repeat protein